MVRTRVGYAGGTKADPTYHALGDHAESFQVDYDPERISYERLLDLFWASHDPTSGSFCAQYAAILFTADEEQERLALASRDRIAARLGEPVKTGIRRLDRFWPAEDYHQKYELRHAGAAMDALRRTFPDETSFRESPAAAKLNAWAAGDLSREDLERELTALGLRPSDYLSGSSR